MQHGMREECIANCSGDSVKNKHHWVLSLMMGDNICDNTGHSGGSHPGERGTLAGDMRVMLHCDTL